MAVGVLLIGLLSVIMLVTAGAFRMSQAIQADRGTTVAQCALEELKTRGMLDSSGWVVRNGSNWVLTGTATPGSTYAIDPYFIANGTTNASDLAAFDSTHCNVFPYYASGTPITMPRVTFNGTMGAGGPSPMALANTERVFVSHDDLLIDTPSDPAIRTKLLFVTTFGSFTDNPNIAGVPQIDGAYSWLATVTPDANDPLQRTFSVSVAVFPQSRPLAANHANRRFPLHAA